MDMESDEVCQSPVGIYEAPNVNRCMRMDERWYCHKSMRRTANGCLATILIKRQIPDWCRLRISSQGLYYEIVNRQQILISVTETTTLQPRCWPTNTQPQQLYPGTYMLSLEQCPRLNIDGQEFSPNPYADSVEVEVMFLKTDTPVIGLQRLSMHEQDPGETLTNLKLTNLRDLIDKQENLVWFSVITSGIVVSVCLVCTIQRCCLYMGGRIMDKCINGDPSIVTNPATCQTRPEEASDRRIRDSARQRRERQAVALRALPAPRPTT